MARIQRRTKKPKRTVAEGVAHIKSTFNNTMITITDRNGDVLASASAGTAGFKGTTKGTPFAAQQAAQIVAKRAIDYGMRRIDVLVKGPGSGRETAIRTLQSTGLDVGFIKDVTPVPHNGCRHRKRRRV